MIFNRSSSLKFSTDVSLGGIFLIARIRSLMSIMISTQTVRALSTAFILSEENTDIDVRRCFDRSCLCRSEQQGKINFRNMLLKGLRQGFYGEFFWHFLMD